MKNAINLTTGDLVEVILKDGRQYKGIIVENYPSKRGFYARVLESSGRKLPKSSWSRYGIDRGIYQELTYCRTVSVISHPQRIKLEEVTDTVVYQTTDPDTKKMYTFSVSEGYGGWSDSDNSDLALVESCYNAAESKKEDEDNA